MVSLLKFYFCSCCSITSKKHSQWIKCQILRWNRRFSLKVQVKHKPSHYSYCVYGPSLGKHGAWRWSHYAWASFRFLSSPLPVFHVRNTLIFQVISPHLVAISSGPHPCYLFRSLGRALSFAIPSEALILHQLISAQTAPSLTLSFSLFLFWKTGPQSLLKRTRGRLVRRIWDSESRWVLAWPKHSKSSHFQPVWVECIAEDRVTQ